MGDGNELLKPEHKKVKTNTEDKQTIPVVKDQYRHKYMSDIIALMKLTAGKRRMELISTYVDHVSEFILHKAEKACRENKKNAISTKDIKKVIISENLFFLSDLIEICK